ncbi:ABC transporter ATP-binding protein [Ramlibacter sp. PS3R-8]|uniref:ABC transporter ATP-binding protein n=1 Tax=Ramlibacter sp. PS3R-8 TaxID=3133437 RepID=UPI0030972605
MSILSLRDVRFSFPGWPPTVEGANLEVEEGAFHCLVGRSGCGKTTLLKLAAGLLAPNAGHVDFRSRHPQAPGRDIGFVFQSPNLLEWRSVIDNVLLPVALHRRPTAQERDRACGLLAQLGLAAHAHKVPGQLSGGQQSRVALARALVLQPSLLLLDEPFAALDAITREELQRDLQRMRHEAGTTVLFVTHDIAEAVYLADRVDVIEGGRIAQQIPIALPSRNAGVRYSAGFGRYCIQVRDALHLEAVPA